MKTSGLLYSSESNKHASERFLSKQELRKLFPDDNEVVLTINYVRKSYKAHKVKEPGTRSKKSKKQKFLKASYPKSKNKSRVIRLYPL